MAYWRLTVKQPFGASEAFDLRDRFSVTVGDDPASDICVSTVDIPSQLKVIQKRWGKIDLKLTDEILPSLEGTYSRRKTWKNRLYSGAWIRVEGTASFKIGDAQFAVERHEAIALSPVSRDLGLESKNWMKAGLGSLVTHAILFGLIALIAVFTGSTKERDISAELQKITIADAQKIFEKPKPEPVIETENAVAASQGSTPTDLPSSKKPLAAAAPKIVKKAVAPKKVQRLEDLGLLALQKTTKPQHTNIDLAEVAQGIRSQSKAKTPESVDLGLQNGKDSLTLAQGIDGAKELSSIASSRVKSYQGGLSDKVQSGAQRVKSITLVKREVEVRGGLDAAVIRQIIEEREPEVKYCYENALLKKDNLEGKLAASWTIRPDGSVSDLVLQSDEIAEGILKKCMGEQMKRWKFPQPKGGGLVRVKYPFLFSLL